MKSCQTFRILDAAANRAGEGLRVVEDFVRFVLDDAHLTRQTKNLRHELATACSALPLADRHASRETSQDVGTTITTAAESQRHNAWDVCAASLERAKQSLRSLEEYSKIESSELSAKFEALRYQLYTLERCLSITQDSCDRLSNCRLCVLIHGQSSIESFKNLVAELFDAGVGMIQLRDKNLCDVDLLARARQLCQMASQCDSANPSPTPSLQGRRIFILINDRPDIAVLADADGVHLGQDDMSVKDARAIVGPRKLIGVSTHSIEQVRAAALDGANYLGAGPTFPSPTKAFDAFPGLKFLKQLAGETSLPTFAIGGIDAENLEQVLATGISRVAVSGAVSAEPSEAVKQLLCLLKRSAEEPSTPAGG